MTTNPFIADLAVVCVVIGMVGLTLTLLYLLYSVVERHRFNLEQARRVQLALHVGDLRSSLKHGRRFDKR